jgi:hypothetical protein
MKRITMHLRGVKPVLTEKKKRNKDGTYEYIKKMKCMNTVTSICKDENEGKAFMAHYLESHRGVKVTKYYFTNV